MTRAAVYVRVSTEDQAREGFSLEAQRERLIAYCQAKAWDVAKVYVEDGHSGRTIRRPAYQEMIAERTSWDALLALKMDRIHRNSRNFMAMMDDLRSWGKDFVSATESLDTSTAMGRFVVDIMQRIAQLESEQIGERVKMGLAQKFKKEAAYTGIAKAAFGYDLTHGRLRVVADQAEIVRQIFRAALEDWSNERIAKYLNEHEVTTRDGKLWTQSKIHRLLHNPVYAGVLKWDDALKPGRHEAIVDVQDFNRAQVALASRSIRTHPTKAKLLIAP